MPPSITSFPLVCWPPLACRSKAANLALLAPCATSARLVSQVGIFTVIANDATIFLLLQSGDLWGRLPDVARGPLRRRIHLHLRSAALLEGHFVVAGDFARRRLLLAMSLAVRRPTLARKPIHNAFEGLNLLRGAKHLVDRTTELSAERAIRPGPDRVDALRPCAAELRNFGGACGVDLNRISNPLGCIDAEKIRKRALIHPACECTAFISSCHRCIW